MNTDLARHAEAEKLLSQERYKEALSLAELMVTPELRATILIDAGYGSRKSSPIQRGINLLEEALKAASSSKYPFSRSSLLYNIANGHYALFMLRRLRGRATQIAPNDDNLRAAKRRYREAISELRREPKSFRTQLWVNYGNCLSQLGRGIEAIQCYKDALNADLKNGMASGNLGVELYHVARITGRYYHNYVLAAQAALSNALGTSMHLDYGTPEAAKAFRATLAKLKQIIEAHRGNLSPTKPAKPPWRNKKISPYIRFCQESSLFLNAWVGDANQAPALTDEIGFTPIITPLHDNETVPELVRILNEVKESYTTARYLYYLSRNPNPELENVSRLTLYFDVIRKDLHGTSIGLCKAAYVRAFDVLDKVARIVNVYFSIGKRNASFWNIFSERQSRGQAHEMRFIARPTVANTRNYSLYALADLCIDYFESESVDLKMIDTLRNRITHDYLAVRSEQEKDSAEPNTISLNELERQTHAVLHLAKYASLYAVSAIHIAERKNPIGRRTLVTIRPL